jgi:hypothetical protein
VGEGVSDDFNLGCTTSEFGCFALSLHYAAALLYITHNRRLGSFFEIPPTISWVP